MSPGLVVLTAVNNVYLYLYLYQLSVCRDHTLFIIKKKPLSWKARWGAIKGCHSCPRIPLCADRPQRVTMLVIVVEVRLTNWHLVSACYKRPPQLTNAPVAACGEAPTSTSYNYNCSGWFANYCDNSHLATRVLLWAPIMQSKWLATDTPSPRHHVGPFYNFNLGALCV